MKRKIIYFVVGLLMIFAGQITFNLYVKNKSLIYAFIPIWGISYFIYIRILIELTKRK